MNNPNQLVGLILIAPVMWLALTTLIFIAFDTHDKDGSLARMCSMLSLFILMACAGAYLFTH